ncbi:hypothetical protein VC83_07443 [Pseudogymnoascus destructans]|uniref:Uncharacterized protein n=1 Tax=Pseudogymnoascus destructans TaxID=655981 RepID=A0A177A4F2_9PEZI|nr:uncharacterized protein VC83_07443 [Pseudogymnoascus destructans]OAF56131.1 hypothetical protein VC83_07443 [Pseudogymnoascus destructans]
MRRRFSSISLRQRSPLPTRRRLPTTTMSSATLSRTPPQYSELFDSDNPIADVFSDSFSSSQRLSSLNQVPPGLEYIGKLNQFKWTKDTHDIFIEWWKLSRWYEQHSEQHSDHTTKLLTKIAWDSTNRSSQYWRSYHQEQTGFLENHASFVLIVRRPLRILQSSLLAQSLWQHILHQTFAKRSHGWVRIVSIKCESIKCDLNKIIFSHKRYFMNKFYTQLSRLIARSAQSRILTKTL